MTSIYGYARVSTKEQNEDRQLIALRNAGGYVAGVAYSEDFYTAEYIITNDKLDLEKLKGSKYIETDKRDIQFS